ncbi:MAG: ankyrin repeat domain-containing protein [Cocleimonas sp.]|nr:ankyrin repeat domain-containing protein [Cocleimonas sp.]
MSKSVLSFFIILSVFMLSACTSTTRNVNYKLYKSRLQAQSYVTGKRYKVRPMISNRDVQRVKRTPPRIQRVSNRQQAYCPPPSYTSTSYSTVIRKTAYQPRKKVRKVYQRPTARKAKIAYKRPVVRKVKQYRKVYKRPVVRKARVQYRAKPVYKRPIRRKVYIAPQRKVVRYQPVAPKLSVAELNDRLFNAAKAGNVRQINTLLSQGAKINASNYSRETALHVAAARGRSSAVSLLLKKGANPNATTTGGWTPLHSAARFRHRQAASLLVTRGAQVNARNNQGKTPVALAKQVGANATVATLTALGGR